MVGVVMFDFWTIWEQCCKMIDTIVIGSGIELMYKKFQKRQNPKSLLRWSTLPETRERFENVQSAFWQDFLQNSETNGLEERVQLRNLK